ncbi:hypothetical protein DV702_01770 [Sporosarcina sp. PTS2304]|uniref:hypothetical protein n=1 Tax=Sporosarcina sp. PTS2304 TaxID=2283194 RepID=UPI000E0CCD5E|nr:hypothetical protein [Sporosarcina sp. PTS2304]AXH98547.1 hypothetical protein DV702_01770 [Sporosarcina sp. PTS2304]
MNNKWRIVFASFAVSIMLAACGTSDTNETDKENTTGSTVEEPTTPETDVEENDSVAVEDPNTDQDGLKDAVETKSDEQDYSIMVLPGYVLASEEPGRDSLYVEEDSGLFMRIETMSKEDESYTFDELYENMEELLAASSDGETPAELTADSDLPKNEGILNVKGAEVKSDEGYFKGFVMEREDMLIRVTIYAAEENEHVEEFKQMASTIK